MRRSHALATLLALFPFLAPASLAGAEPRAHPDAESVQPLAPGAVVPAVTVRGVGGEPVVLSDLVRERGALLVFYRGGW